jgi:hypothetical protein
MINLTGASWRKSTYSGGSGGECVEVAEGFPVVPVRDSKDPEGPALVFSTSAWAAFIVEVKADGFSAA